MGFRDIEFIRELLVVIECWWLLCVLFDFVINDLNVLNLLLLFILSWEFDRCILLKELKLLKFWLWFFKGFLEEVDGVGSCVYEELLNILKDMFCKFFVDLNVLKLMFFLGIDWLVILNFLKLVKLLFVVRFLVVVIGFWILNSLFLELKLVFFKVLYLFLDVLVVMVVWDGLFFNIVGKFVKLFGGFVLEFCFFLFFKFFLLVEYLFFGRFGILIFVCVDRREWLENLNFFNDEVSFLELLELIFVELLLVIVDGLGLCWKLLKLLVLVKLLLLIFEIDLVEELVLLGNKLMLVSLDFLVLVCSFFLIWKFLSFLVVFCGICGCLDFMIDVIFKLLELDFFLFWKLLKLFFWGFVVIDKGLELELVLLNLVLKLLKLDFFDRVDFWLKLVVMLLLNGVVLFWKLLKLFWFNVCFILGICLL